jgi:hypothetical protein
MAPPAHCFQLLTVALQRRWVHVEPNRSELFAQLRRRATARPRFGCRRAIRYAISFSPATTGWQLENLISGVAALELSAVSTNARGVVTTLAGLEAAGRISRSYRQSPLCNWCAAFVMSFRCKSRTPRPADKTRE